MSTGGREDKSLFDTHIKRCYNIPRKLNERSLCNAVRLRAEYVTSEGIWGGRGMRWESAATAIIV